MTASKTTATPREPALPPLTDGELGTIVSLKLVEKETKPPLPFNEGSLIEGMKNAGSEVEDAEHRKVLRETSGLGTSATRDSIVESLKHHKYLETVKGNIVPTDKGTRFILWLDKVCPELTDIVQTAKWEAKLDAVASNGGGREFQAGVTARVRELVSVLKSSSPIFASSNKENSDMSDGQEQRASKPTAKQLEYAQRIAQKLGKQDEFEAAKASYEACSAFIEANKDAANRPTEKQVAFATRIASEKGLTVPEDALKDGRELSKWIDANK